MPPLTDYTGKRFGRLTVICRAPNRDYLRGGCKVYWVCKCDCGKTIEISRAHLQSGHTKSCGCIHREQLAEKNTTHGFSGTRIYSIWLGMKSRCGNENNKRFLHYGGRGIKVCPEWEAEFENFRRWAIENGYSDDLTIERIDVNGDYCPENCCFIPLSEQANNKQNSVYFEFNGEKITQQEASRRTGIPSSTICRKRKKGISLEEMRK